MRFSTDEAAAELLMSDLWDHGTTGIFQAAAGKVVEIAAGFDSEADADAVVSWLAAHRDVDRCTVVAEPAPTAASLAVSDVPATITFEGQGRSVDLTIRSGGVFGHGAHRTTRLAADLLMEWLEPNHRVLDIGAGTGVLAILAAKAGAGAVVGLDNDPLAVEVAIGNAAANGVNVPFGLWSVAAAAEMFHGPIDISVMNVLLPVHLELAPEVVAATAEGLLITAGYLDEQSAEILACYGECFTAVTGRSIDGWSAHVFAPHTSPVQC